MEAFQQRDLGDFIIALEFMNADVNHASEAGFTVFHDILKTPRSADFIKNCISNGADCYAVSGSLSIHFVSHCSLNIFRNPPTTVFPCTMPSTRYAPKI